MNDPVLATNVAKAIDPLLKNLLNDPVAATPALRHYLYDLYSLDKPQAGPVIALKTDLLPIFLTSVTQLYFEDAYENPE